MSDHITEALHGILTEDLDLALGDVTRDSRLIDDLGLDSVAFAIGVVAIEERLGVKLSERELFESKTVGDLEDLVRAKAGTPAGSQSADAVDAKVVPTVQGAGSLPDRATVRRGPAPGARPTGKRGKRRS